MTQLLPPSNLFTSTYTSTLKSFGAEEVTAVDESLVKVLFPTAAAAESASALFVSNAASGVRVIYMSPNDTGGSAPAIDAKTAIAFLKQHPGVVDVATFDMPTGRTLLIPGTVDGPTAATLNQLLDTAGTARMPVQLGAARPADAVPTVPGPDAPQPTPAS